MSCIWTPQPRQAEFMARPEYEVLYGGAAGGGKSDALVIEALRQVHIPHYKCLILRKTFPQCRELIDKSLLYYRQAYPQARYNSTEHIWTFPSGAKIIFGSIPHTRSMYDYQGQSYDVIMFDELTHFKLEEYDFLLTRNRPNGEGTRVYTRSSANPGGIGHGWVKERFIKAAPANTPYTYTVTVRMPDGTPVEMTRKRIFIPSSVFDNKRLLENDPGYLITLASKPEALQKALLYGDWDSFSGQVFTEFRNNPDGYESGINTHVIEDFEIPKWWQRYRAYDFGFAKPYAVLWFAMSPDGIAYLYRELYGCTGEPNVGVLQNSDRQAQKVAEIEESEMKGASIIGVADPSIWDKSRGSAIVNSFTDRGIYFEKGKNERLIGKMQVHNRLQFDETGIPRLYFFKSCKDSIRTIQELVYSARDVEDVDTAGEDHIYDALRYFLMLNPISSRPKKTTVQRAYSPFE